MHDRAEDIDDLARAIGLFEDIIAMREKDKSTWNPTRDQHYKGIEAKNDWISRRMWISLEAAVNNHHLSERYVNAARETVIRLAGPMFNYSLNCLNHHHIALLVRIELFDALGFVKAFMKLDKRGESYTEPMKMSRRFKYIPDRYRETAEYQNWKEALGVDDVGLEGLMTQAAIELTNEPEEQS